MTRYEKGPRKQWQKFYDTADWRETSNTLKRYNPLCQRILADGKQCQKPPTVSHHLIDPRNAPHLRLAFSNLVAVCANHHPGGQCGADEAEVYCRTIGPMEASYAHGHDIWPSWHRNYIPLACAPPSPTKATAIGDAALDAALDAYQKMAVEKNQTHHTGQLD